jgi:uncharacterized protein (UPF0276 family)
MSSASKNNANTGSKPFLGYGLCLRPEYYDTIVENQPEVDWFEIITENYMVDGGKPIHFLDRVRENYPIVMHGVSLSIGGTDPLDKNYLKRLKQLINYAEPQWISDHLCWTSHGGYNLHDLLPLPCTEEAIKHVVSRLEQVQDFLGQQILLENASTYLSFDNAEMTEWDFYREVVERADSLMLLDVNNIYVCARNHDFDAIEFLDSMPAERIRQMHVSGHSDYGDYVVDTHDHPVVKPVWELFSEALKRFGPVSSMIERDDRFPPFEELMAELSEMRSIAANVGANIKPSEKESKQCSV